MPSINSIPKPPPEGYCGWGDILKNFGDLNELELEDSTWGFMALESVFEIIENRDMRGSKS